jgi:hypothetical protein
MHQKAAAISDFRDSLRAVSSAPGAQRLGD